MSGAARRGNAERMSANPDDDDNIEIIGGDRRQMPDDDADGKSLTDLVEQPAKVMRIGTMIKQLLEEVRAAPLDDASRGKLARDPQDQHPRAGGGPGARTARRARAADAAVHRGLACRPTPSCESPRRSWSAGWKDCSTASRPRCSPSRWRPASSSSRCARARCRPASASRDNAAGPAARHRAVPVAAAQSWQHRISRRATRGWSSPSSTPSRAR